MSQSTLTEVERGKELRGTRAEVTVWFDPVSLIEKMIHVPCSSDRLALLHVGSAVSSQRLKLSEDLPSRVLALELQLFRRCCLCPTPVWLLLVPFLLTAEIT